ncbi:MAG TPA: CPBP family intramembrane metalloprotease [Anaerolineae bacterium]|nr:CPBP family intramembrane metalloprotease [Anaerolineae bacterium]HQK13046.1 CPBP family intramembrane metalloprotease [Anaerolineae bacterium]
MENTPQNRETPSLLIANLYLLLGLLVLIGGSYATRKFNTRYVAGIVIECLLALIALLFQRLEKLSLRETLRWRWPGWLPFALSAGLAFGLWISGIVLNLTTTALLGYSTPIAPTMFPRNATEAFLLVLSTVIVAPICEEIMFRGYVQRAYERRSPWIGVTVGGIIFAMYHLRFQGVFALLPVAFALGFVAWRSNSLFPGMLLHAAYNSIATTVLITTSFSSAMVTGGVVIALLCLGLLMTPMALTALWGLWRTTHPPVKPALPGPTGWQKWAWRLSLVVMFGIYGFAAVWEILEGRFPKVLAQEALTLKPPTAWDTSLSWNYVLNGGINQTVGKAACTLSPEPDTVALSCQVQQEPFEAEMPFKMPEGFALTTLPGISLRGDAFTATQHVVWKKADLALQALTGTRETDSTALTLTHPVSATDRQLRVESESGSETVSLPPGVLFDGEWPWRLSALPFAIAYGSTHPLALVGDDGHIHIVEAFILVTGSEPVWTPAGNFVTWKVTVTYTLDDEETTLAAWYDVDPPHTLVRYDNGEVSYLLEKVQ